jgi:hypothetical protein
MTRSGTTRSQRRGSSLLSALRVFGYVTVLLAGGSVPALAVVQLLIVPGDVQLRLLTGWLVRSEARAFLPLLHRAEVGLVGVLLLFVAARTGLLGLLGRGLRATARTLAGRAEPPPTTGLDHQAPADRTGAATPGGSVATGADVRARNAAGTEPAATTEPGARAAPGDRGGPATPTGAAIHAQPTARPATTWTEAARTPAARTPAGWTQAGWTQAARTPAARTQAARTPVARTPAGWTEAGWTDGDPAPPPSPTGLDQERPDRSEAGSAAARPPTGCWDGTRPLPRRLRRCQDPTGALVRVTTITGPVGRAIVGGRPYTVCSTGPRLRGDVPYVVLGRDGDILIVATDVAD